MTEAVRLQARRVRNRGEKFHYTVTVPKDFVKEMGLAKGDILFVKLTEYKGRPAIVYYKP